MNNKLKTCLATFIFSMIFLTVLSFFVGKIFYQNLSPSAPTGLYIITPFQNITYGDYAIVSLPADVPQLHVSKGFLLLKQVKGLPGDRYTVTNNGTHIHGNVYPSSPRPGLPVVDTGEYTVPNDSILFLNNPADSFDSRYLGPIQKNFIQKKVMLLIPYSFD